MDSSIKKTQSSFIKFESVIDSTIGCRISEFYLNYMVESHELVLTANFITNITN